MNIQLLRQQTEPDHRAAEEAMPLTLPDLDAARYVHCLTRMYQVVAAWEEAAPALAPDWLRTTLVTRARKPLLQQDLAWFGIAEPAARAVLPLLNDLPSLLGAMYVMEGSTLGGRIIARHVALSLSLTQGRGDAFFRGHGDQTGPLWKEFCQMIETRIPDDQTDAVIVSAKAMFVAFANTVQEKSVMDGS